MIFRKCWLLMTLLFFFFLPGCGAATMISFWVEPRGKWFACCQAGTVQYHSYARYSEGRTEELTLLSDWKVYISGSRGEPQEVTVDGKGLVSVHDPCAFRDVTVRAKYGPEDRIAMAVLYFEPCL